MQDISDVFKGGTESMDRIVILPWGTYGADDYTSQSDIPWNEFESIEVFSAYSGATTANRDSTTAPKEQIAQNPTGWELVCTSSISSNTIQAVITATGSNTFNIGSAVNCVIKGIIGYKRKLSTRNSSKTILVNGGADIVAGGIRYPIDIASVLGTEYVGKKLDIRLELFINGKWGAWVAGVVPYYTGSSWNSNGVGWTTTDTVIEVFTADIRLIQGSAPNSWGLAIGSITSAPCRLKVSLTEEAFPATKSSGGMELIWSGSAGDGVTVDWSGTGKTLSDYDLILCTYTDDNGRKFTHLNTPESLIGASAFVSLHVASSLQGYGGIDSILESQARAQILFIGYGSVALTNISGIKLN